MARPKILVLISGNGSNLQAIIDAQKADKIDADIIRVISSSPDAYGLERAEKANIPTTVHQLKSYYKDLPKGDRPKARKQFNKDLANLVIYGNVDGDEDKKHIKPDLIVCAGWMLILAPEFLSPVEDEGIHIINLHPALPGAFDGTHAIERAWQAGQDGEITKGGVMIHKVIQQVDAGEPLLVKEIDIVKGETVEQYEEKVHNVEHVAIVEGTNIALKELVLKDTKDETKEDK
ncbi:Phosphoribosylglycinamide formyltransferase [Cyberlindnera fabianii]|uniref:Phosphoribosylglycinamide formyltransferase n=1 Tax=Cyberlindnera fabianii TaxID=36022 RepID=A0A1V2L1U2_CYBFA|nr:Phosphoribosylglycinamide formyltransferase [Cyberlindnera fabianii]